MFSLARQFISADIAWYNNLDAVFMQIYPRVNAFAQTLIDDVVGNKTTKTYTMNISMLNQSIKSTTEQLIRLIQELSDYFQIFNSSVEDVKSEILPVQN